jgi:hypothetical protein
MPKFIQLGEDFYNLEQIRKVAFRNLKDKCIISLSLIPVPFNEILLDLTNLQQTKNFIVTKEVAEKIREQLRDC